MSLLKDFKAFALPYGNGHNHVFGVRADRAIADTGVIMLTGIGGITSFGQAAFVGIGALLKPRVRIGEGAVVAMGGGTNALFKEIGTRLRLFLDNLQRSAAISLWCRCSPTTTAWCRTAR